MQSASTSVRARGGGLTDTERKWAWPLQNSEIHVVLLHILLPLQWILVLLLKVKSTYLLKNSGRGHVSLYFREGETISLVSSSLALVVRDLCIKNYCNNFCRFILFSNVILMIQLNIVLLFIPFYFVELSMFTGWNLCISQAPFTHTYNYVRRK